ncbi:MAG: DNA-formamidopyrimidine glycosylase family protein [Planctomycetota bacterium]
MRPNMEGLQKRLTGHDVVAVERIGKRVVIVLSDQSRLIIEPRMSGIVLLGDVPSREHVRLILQFDDGQTMLFWDRRGLGTVTLMTASKFQQWSDSGVIGPDALLIDRPALKARLGGSRRAIKPALLDQRAVAGIGNMYAAEILHLAGIDPRTRCDRLSNPQWDRIVAATRRVLNQAIDYEGSTLSDGTYRNALNDPGGFQNYLQVYDRHSQTCARCAEGTIRRIVQSQRSTFFCPVCQKRSGLHASVVDLIASD